MSAHTRIPDEGQISISRVLDQTRGVKSTLQQCASDLRSSNSAILQHMGQDAPTALYSAMAVSEQVQLRVQEGSDRLSVVNDTLEGQLRDRILLDFRFAAAVEQEEAARRAALHDALTGLPNRALFTDRLEHGLAQARRHEWKFAVMFMDLDNFKKVNDEHGHHVGDRVLQQVAQRAVASIRAEDTVSRYGGDEFLYIVNDIQDQQCVARLAKKIIATVQAPYDVGADGAGALLSVRASIGIAMYPADGAAADVLLKSADKAMYRAKKDGNTYAFA